MLCSFDSKPHPSSLTKGQARKIPPDRAVLARVRRWRYFYCKATPSPRRWGSKHIATIAVGSPHQVQKFLRVKGTFQKVPLRCARQSLATLLANNSPLRQPYGCHLSRRARLYNSHFQKFLKVTETFFKKFPCRCARLSLASLPCRCRAEPRKKKSWQDVGERAQKLPCFKIKNMIDKSNSLCYNV